VSRWKGALYIYCIVLYCIVRTIVHGQINFCFLVVLSFIVQFSSNSSTSKFQWKLSYHTDLNIRWQEYLINPVFIIPIPSGPFTALIEDCRIIPYLVSQPKTLSRALWPGRACVESLFWVHFVFLVPKEGFVGRLFTNGAINTLKLTTVYRRFGYFPWNGHEETAMPSVIDLVN
jgi:hypothetical protein